LADPSHARSYEDKHVVADGKRALNLLSHNFLNLANTPQMLVGVLGGQGGAGVASVPGGEA